MTEGQEKSTPHDLRNCPAMRALEYLTPGGSEYVDDIPRCIATVRESHSTVMRQLVKVTKELHALRSVAGGEPEQWISAECKPELNAGRVLTSVHGLGFRVRTIGLWDGEEWKFDRAGMAGTVTHWRPLPAPPQGKEQK